MVVFEWWLLNDGFFMAALCFTFVLTGTTPEELVENIELCRIEGGAAFVWAG
jgi:hypothetical protein